MTLLWVWPMYCTLDYEVIDCAPVDVVPCAPALPLQYIGSGGKCRDLTTMAWSTNSPPMSTPSNGGGRWGITLIGA